MKKILLILSMIAICVTGFNPFLTAYAQENQNTVEVSNTELEMFINVLDETDPVFDRKNIIEASDENGIKTVVIDDGKDGFILYETPTNDEELNGDFNPQTKGVIRTIIGIISAVYRGGKLVSTVVKNIQGSDICGAISKQILASLAVGKKYKATAYLYKNPNCQPMHSQQCNMYPNVYWKTTVVPA